MTECSTHLSDIQWGGICMAQDSCPVEMVRASAGGSAQCPDMLAIKLKELPMETLSMSLPGVKHHWKARGACDRAVGKPRSGAKTGGLRHTANNSGSTPVTILLGLGGGPNPQSNLRHLSKNIIEKHTLTFA